MTDAKGLKNFRKEHDYKLVDRYESRPIGNTDIRSDLAEKKFGKANRPSTPIKGIIWGSYADLVEEKAD